MRFSKELMCIDTTRPTHLPYNGCNLRPWQNVRIDYAHDLLFGIAAGCHQLRKRFACGLRCREQSLSYVHSQSTAYNDIGRLHAAKRRKYKDKDSAPSC